MGRAARGRLEQGSQPHPTNPSKSVLLSTKKHLIAVVNDYLAAIL
jgi:hypothetical protein